MSQLTDNASLPPSALSLPMSLLTKILACAVIATADKHNQFSQTSWQNPRVLPTSLLVAGHPSHIFIDGDTIAAFSSNFTKVNETVDFKTLSTGLGYYTGTGIVSFVATFSRVSWARQAQFPQEWFCHFGISGTHDHWLAKIQSDDRIIVTMTRPATKLGDTANPSMCFPTSANEQVDKVFGIGAVKITPAHDRNACTPVSILSPLVTEVEIFLHLTLAHLLLNADNWLKETVDFSQYHPVSVLKIGWDSVKVVHHTVSGTPRLTSLYHLFRMPKEQKLRFIDVSFDPATSVMSQRERGHRQQFRRNIASASDGSRTDSQMHFYVLPGPDTAQFAPTSTQTVSSPGPLVTPLPLPPPSPPPPPPSPLPSPLLFTQPSPPFFPQLSPPLSPMSFNQPSPPSSPLPAPLLQMPSDTTSPPDSLASIVAQLSDLQWDLDHPEMWNACIDFAENDEN
ncbi:hypothetical protein EDD22DRAFT_849042 [Suillus occidentalis]|nr:hypothetical protein EDD22DRAFT_849042 [Suillus occidentalis]